MAENLVRHKADINRLNNQNQTLLHLAIKRGLIYKKIFFSIFIKIYLGDEHSATFLIKHCCLLDHQTNTQYETPLHLLSSLNSNELSSDVMDAMCRVAQLIIEYGGDTNKKDAQGNNSLHRAILADNMDVFQELLKASNLSLDERNNDDHVPLWLALQQAEQTSKSIGNTR
jgi:ankyrin repeat protein